MWHFHLCCVLWVTASVSVSNSKSIETLPAAIWAITTSNYAASCNASNTDSACCLPQIIQFQKLDSPGYIFVADSMALFSKFGAVVASKAVVLCEIMHNDGHTAIQGHSRSPVLVPIKSRCVTSCWWQQWLISHISKLSLHIGQITLYQEHQEHQLDLLFIRPQFTYDQLVD